MSAVRAVLLALGVLSKRVLLSYGTMGLLVIASDKGFLFDGRNLRACCA